MDNIIQCSFCALPFQKTTTPVCYNCLEKIDLDFVKIRDYLYDNPGTFDIDTLCKETEVTKKVVLHLIKEKRLIVSSDEKVFSCTVCGKGISEGQICEDCRESLSKSLNEAVSDMNKDKNGKDRNIGMHTRWHTGDES